MSGFWRWYDRGARADFAGNILGLVFDWRNWLWGLVPGGGGMTFLWAAIEGRSPLDVWIAAVIVMAGLAVVAYLSILVLEKCEKKETPDSRSTVSKANEFVGDIPDVRIADDPVAWGLFETSKERDKLIPLLESGRLIAWGRLGSGNPPLIKIPANQWATHYLDDRPADSPGRINQTYFRPKSRTYESTYYDVHLNRDQLERAWPGLWQRTSLDRIPITELMKMATARGWDFASHDTLHLLDMQKAIRQGASDNHLTVWGILNKWSSEELLQNEILEKIPSEHWRTFYVSLFPALDGDNFHTKSWTPSRTPQNYLDLHVNRREAETWLDRDAATFRGKTTPDQRGMP